MDKVQDGRREHSGLCCGRARGKPWTVPAEEKSPAPSFASVPAEEKQMWEPVASPSEAREGGRGCGEGIAEAAKPHTRTQSCWRSVVPSFSGCFFSLNGRLTLIFMMAHFLCGVFPIRLTGITYLTVK